MNIHYSAEITLSAAETKKYRTNATFRKAVLKEARKVGKIIGMPSGKRPPITNEEQNTYGDPWLYDLGNNGQAGGYGKY